MDCDNTEIHLKLPDYVTRKLDAAGVRAVEEHLADCPACRDSVEVMRLLASPDADREKTTSSHIDLDLLGRYVRARDSLRADELASIERHLSACRVCDAAVEFLSGLDEEVRASLVKTKGAVSPSHGAVSAFRDFWRHPKRILSVTAVAAVVVIAFVLIRSERDRTISPKVFALTELRRSAQQIPVVTISDANARIVLKVPYFSDLRDYHYQYRVTDTLGNEMTQVALTSDLSTAGELMLSCQFHGLGDGRFRILVYEISKTEPPDSTITEFPFELRTGK